MSSPGNRAIEMMLATQPDWCSVCYGFTNHKSNGVCLVCWPDETTAELDTRELPAYDDDNAPTEPGVTI